MMSGQEYYDLHHERFLYCFIKNVGREPIGTELEDILDEEYKDYCKNKLGEKDD